MKAQKLFTLIVAIVTAMTVNAQQIALHSANGVQIFTGNTALDLAYTAAQNGDTLYLSGGGFTPPADFDKGLTIFGAGHYVDSTRTTGKTSIIGNIILKENADLFYLEGVEITGNFTITTNHSVNNVSIKRCKLNGTFTASGDLSNPTSNLGLIGNVLVGELNLQNIQNSILSNNIFVNAFVNSNGNLISNNIVMGHVWYPHYFFIGSNNTLNNNIFLTTTPDSPSGSGNIFNNNLFVKSNPNYETGATSIGNYVGVYRYSIFVNQTGYTFDYSHDYHLQTPNIYLGIDGSQVGIYGGAFPYKEGAVPLNPHIQVKNIAPTTDADGNLQIQIQVEAQND